MIKYVINDNVVSPEYCLERKINPNLTLVR